MCIKPRSSWERQEERAPLAALLGFSQARLTDLIFLGTNASSRYSRPGNVALGYRAFD